MAPLTESFTGTTRLSPLAGPADTSARDGRPNLARAHVGGRTIGVVDEDRSSDRWVADEGGPEAVVAMVQSVRQQADEGCSKASPTRRSSWLM